MTGTFKMPGTILGSMRRSQSTRRSRIGKNIAWTAWLCAMALCALPAKAQVDLSSLDRLSDKAEESVEINLDATAIQLAGGFLAASNEEAAPQLQEILSKLTSIAVRTLEFNKGKQYSDADLNAVRNQLRSPDWSRIVNIKGDDERVEVYIRQANGAINGVTALVSEEDELTIASIEGEINLDALAALGGSFGIPKLPIPAANSNGKQ